MLPVQISNWIIHYSTQKVTEKNSKLLLCVLVTFIIHILNSSAPHFTCIFKDESASDPNRHENLERSKHLKLEHRVWLPVVIPLTGSVHHMSPILFSPVSKCPLRPRELYQHQEPRTIMRNGAPDQTLQIQESGFRNGKIADRPLNSRCGGFFYTETF